ncbi:nucleotidyltransferase family protein [Candidatus Saccharibacteria bacterium]|nr:nucleotidyltransferase family protein [Candidatus Saccharibacteria bacterium]
MKCIILAAGYATRLYPLTENFPKPLLEVAGKPILNHLVGDIDGDGFVDEYIIVSNHKFAKNFNDWAKTLPQRITVLDDGTETNETRLGAVKDIQFAIRELNVDDDCFVMAGDNLLDFSLCKFLDFSREKQTSCAMYYKESNTEKLTKTGILEIKDDIVVGMEEKPKNPKSNYVCPPFYYYVAEDIAKINDALADGCEYDAPGSFLAWLCHKSPVHVHEMPGNRYDIGTLESYKAVKKHFEQGD